MSRWGPDGPPLEAYSRVSDPERFRPLHTAAVQLVEQLQAAFDVELQEGYDLDRELEVPDPARPTARLVPRDQRAAPLVIVFTTFPGLRVRAGRWCTAAFPSCGCDACDETAETETRRLTELVEDVVAGRFREWTAWERWSSRDGPPGELEVHSGRDRAMANESGRSAIVWVPWPRRQGQ